MPASCAPWNSPKFEDTYVCRETIYNSVYALPVGELRKELIICPQQGKTTCQPRSGGVDRSGQIPDMVSIHVHPPEIEDRLMSGHWEGNLIKDKANASAVGTLVERTSGYLMLVKMNDTTATSTVEGFSAALNRMPLPVRRSMTYDQGRGDGTACRNHAEDRCDDLLLRPAQSLAARQRGSNENINGLIHQYQPKGTDLSAYSQERLDAIAYELNIRLCKRFNWKCPIEVMTEVMALQQLQHEAPASIQ
ncbi:IS30 family transposase [Azotobacter bryophylli]|uniref:IS30 family transposase n=1 Tax=Azotobacter bryophylli TaxID=1986537 RepID=A0ABV7ATN4_9GAMM